VNPSRKPDYRVRVLHKTTNNKATVGAAWRNEDGSISIVFNPYVALPYDPDLVVRLFPCDVAAAAPEPETV
jgi:hypothetical protein